MKEYNVGDIIIIYNYNPYDQFKYFVYTLTAIDLAADIYAYHLYRFAMPVYTGTTNLNTLNALRADTYHIKPDIFDPNT